MVVLTIIKDLIPRSGRAYPEEIKMKSSLKFEKNSITIPVEKTHTSTNFQHKRLYCIFSQHT